MQKINKLKNMNDSTAAENSTTNTAISENSAISKKVVSISSPIESTTDIKIISNVADLLKNICEENNSIEINNKNIAINKKIKLFMLKKIPSITIKDYLLRLVRYSKINGSTLIFILIYIDRLCLKNKFKITFLNIYKFILTALVIAVKYNEDEFYSSEFYAKLGGISKAEMNIMEYEFITMIHFNLFIKEELFFKYHDLLLNEEKDSNEDEKDDEEK